MTRRALPAVVLVLAAAAAAFAQDLASFEKRVTVKKLENGLTLVVCERPEAPTFSFFTHVDVGGDREVPGITGLAHMFEHMAFKGTDKIGTKDYAAETVALEKVEKAYLAYDAERRRRVGRDDKKVAELEKAWKGAMGDADQYVLTNAFTEMVSREGGTELNAFTSNDETGYFYSLPSNRLELWAYLESERFLKPVMREFYKERDVVVEERRMRTESDPIGRLTEQFLSAAFAAHPYGQPVVGWPSDLASFSATDAMEFYRRYYVPANMVVTIAGDVKAAEVIPMVEAYFGRLPAGPKPLPLRTTEPPQKAERQVVVRDAAQPYYMEGYHRPDSRDPHDAVYDVISDLLSSGRVSRLYRSLVRDKKIAARASGQNAWPGDKYPHLFVFSAVTTPGHTPDEIRDAIRAELERLKNEDVPAEELQMVKTRAKANLLRRLGSNSGLALQLGWYQARVGDWRELFRDVDQMQQVTAADIRTIAQKTFVPENRTVGILESTRMAGAAAGGQ
jgi:predicted Zn-dependent peptidase